MYHSSCVNNFLGVHILGHMGGTFVLVSFYDPLLLFWLQIKMTSQKNMEKLILIIQPLTVSQLISQPFD